VRSKYVTWNLIKPVPTYDEEKGIRTRPTKDTSSY